MGQNFQALFSLLTSSGFGPVRGQPSFEHLASQDTLEYVLKAVKVTNKDVTLEICWSNEFENDATNTAPACVGISVSLTGFFCNRKAGAPWNFMIRDGQCIGISVDVLSQFNGLQKPLRFTKQHIEVMDRSYLLPDSISIGQQFCYSKDFVHGAVVAGLRSVNGVTLTTVDVPSDDVWFELKLRSHDHNTPTIIVKEDESGFAYYPVAGGKIAFGTVCSKLLKGMTPNDLEVIKAAIESYKAAFVNNDRPEVA